MEFIDSHCHIQSAGSKSGEKSTRELWARAPELTTDAIIQRAEGADVTRLVCVGCDLDDSWLAVATAKQHNQCWASVGIHPHESHRYVNDRSLQQTLTALAKTSKVVAIGECGLDYFYEHASKDDQVQVLQQQLACAQALNLPVIFHVRDAFDEFWPIFTVFHTAKALRGVLHSFTDTEENLNRALQYGLYIGVNGISTFTKNPKQQVMYRTIPLDRLVLETDAPFLTPYPYRGKICEPYHIRTIAEFLAGQRNMPVASLADATTRNARQLFTI